MQKELNHKAKALEATNTSKNSISILLYRCIITFVVGLQS